MLSYRHMQTRFHEGMQNLTCAYLHDSPRGGYTESRIRKGRPCGMVPPGGGGVREIISKSDTSANSNHIRDRFRVITWENRWFIL
jgi:hypothetical protein